MFRLFGCAALAASLCILAVPGSADEPNANATSLATATNPMTVALDARLAARGIMRAHLVIPVAPGPFVLVYPKWVPGEHGPTGPLGDLAFMKISANGQTLAWRRDKVDLYAFHLDVPAGVHAVDVDFDVLLNARGDTMATANLAIVNWNRDLLYQNDTDSHQVFVKASVVLPSGWDYGTGLPGAERSGDRVTFALAPLNVLVDSPLDMGRFAKHLRLWQQPGGDATVDFDIFADKPQGLDIPADVVTQYKRIVPEALALYGARHWQHYHALLTLSDAIGFQGIEHHQSSDNRADDDFLTDPQEQLAGGDLVTHEFSHSWNGKYRRPYDLTTPNFQVPQKTDLLWVYEGMNQYLGDLLSFRAGIRAPNAYPEYVASIYADMDSETGREREPLIDLTTGAPFFYTARGDYPVLRRSANDFYTEGELLWLDVDTIIRERTDGKASLDTFLQHYAGPPDTGPIVVTYTRDQIEQLLNGVAPYDWHAFFQQRVYQVAPHPPTSELARSGWKLVYTAEPNAFIAAFDATGHQLDAWYSLGLRLTDGGEIQGVRPDSPAWNAGLAPGMTIEALDGQAFAGADDAKGVLKYVLTSSERSAQPITVIAKGTGFFGTYLLDYHGGPRFPHLVRIPGVPDMLAQIMAPHALPQAP